MFPKSKRKAKDSTWRDYRLLIGLIALCLMVAQFILSFDPIMLSITTPYETQIEFAINTGLVSIWMLIAYWFGRKQGFSHKWMFVCIVASLIAMTMLAMESRYAYFPTDCEYMQLGNSFIWMRTHLGGCINFLILF